MGSQWRRAHVQRQISKASFMIYNRRQANCNRELSMQTNARPAPGGRTALVLLLPIYLHWNSVVACCRIFTSPFRLAARLAMPLAALPLHIGVGRRPSLLLRRRECSLALLVFFDAIRATK